MSSSVLCVTPETALSEALPDCLAGRVLAPLAEMDIRSVEDLYDCIAGVGGNWYRQFAGITREDASALVDWLAENAREVGEVTEVFYPSGCRRAALPAATESVVTALETLHLSETLSGRSRSNRGASNEIDADDDLDAVRVWLDARSANPNTRAQYQKEMERFVLWCTVELGRAMSDVTAREAALYPKWLEMLGRTAPKVWEQNWRVAQDRWIGPKNVERLSPLWRPFNGPLAHASRKSALTIVRLAFGFLTRTGYLRFNPFDQISSKVRFLPGEGAPKAFADRSLTPDQWQAVLDYLNTLEVNASSLRLRVIFALGKGLGMRASEMLNARTGWIVERRIGDENMRMIEIVGKGDKIRRLPLSDEAYADINAYLAARGLDIAELNPADTPLLANLGIGRKSTHPGMSRSGLHRALLTFFEGAAARAQETSPADAAKLRASSAHWLRHTFATSALKVMDINVVQNALGHASIGTTSRYLTPEESQIAAGLKRLGGF